ncbi:MAG: polysaccharide deacetylase family protein, partial [bacterium]
MNPPVLVYHKVEAGFELGVNVVSPATFRRQMEWLAHAGFAAVTLRDALAAGNSAGANARRVVLTFDDGYTGIALHVAPVLRALGFRATIFVPSAFVGARSDWDTALLGRRYRHLDRTALRDLAADGFEIGSHSATHRDLRRLDDAELLAETAGSRQTLADITGHDVVTYCYPFGRSDARVRAAVARAGFIAACGGGAP